MEVLSVVMGVSALRLTLYGGRVQNLLSWRWAFLLFAAACVCFRHSPVSRFCATSRNVQPEVRGHAIFRPLALTCLALGITAIAAAGSRDARLGFPRACYCRACRHRDFLCAHARNKTARRFPRDVQSPDGPRLRMLNGGGTLPVDCSFGYYGPLLLPRSMISRRWTTGSSLPASPSQGRSCHFVATAPKHARSDRPRRRA